MEIDSGYTESKRTGGEELVEVIHPSRLYIHPPEKIVEAGRHLLHHFKKLLLGLVAQLTGDKSV